MSEITRGIAGIRLTNIGKFEAYSLELRDGEIVELQGDNDEGKSTIPLSITAALFGVLEEKTSAKNDAVDGTGTMEIDAAGYHITRQVNRQQETIGLEVIDRNGNRPYEGKAIQTWLDRTFGKLPGKRAGAFINPFELMGMPKKEQIAAIVRALPIDLPYAQERIKAIARDAWDGELTAAEGVFTAIRQLTADFSAERLALGRKVKVAKAAYEGACQALPEDYDPDAAPLPIAPKPMDALYQSKEQIVRANGRRAELTRGISENDAEIRRLEERVAQLRNRNTAMETELHSLGPQQSTDDVQAKIDQHEEAMRQYQAALETHGDRKRRWREKDQFYQDWQEIEAKHGDYDGKVKSLAKLPAELFARSEMPIPGLFIEGETIMLPHPDTGELRPAEEFGDAALLDLFIALSMALAPLPVILADGLERCGPKRSQEIYDRIRARGFQLIGTRVTEGPLKAVRVTVGEQVETLPVSMGEAEPAPELDFDVPDEF